MILNWLPLLNFVPPFIVQYEKLTRTHTKSLPVPQISVQTLHKDLQFSIWNIDFGCVILQYLSEMLVLIHMVVKLED